MPLPPETSAIFRFPANWVSPVTEVREYKTDIMRSRDGTEQRRALRSKPRKTLSFQILLEKTDAAEFDYLMWAAQPHVWLLPFWQRKARLTASAALGGSTLLLSAQLSVEARSGDYLVLMRDGAEPEAQQIDSLSAGGLTINLVDSLEATWPQGTTVYLAERAQLLNPISAQRLNSGVLRSSLEFASLVDTRSPGVSTLTADLEIGGIEVLTRRINWVKSPVIGYDWAPMLVDAQLGPFVYETDGDLAVRTRRAEVLTENRAETDWWLAFFDRVLGRQGVFLAPTWMDLHLQTAVTPGADFEVPGTGLAEYLTADPVHTHVMVRLRSGELAFFEVTYFTPNEAENVTAIFTTEAWEEVYGSEECVQACLVATCRLAADALNIEWLTDGVARLTLAVQTVENTA